MTTDPLSDVLCALRLKSALFSAHDVSAHGASAPGLARGLGSRLLPGAEHVIECHVMTAGARWSAIVNEAPLRLEAGDVLVFPHGDGRGGSSLLEPAGASEPAEMICGFLGCEVRPFQPLLASLPRVLHLPRRASGDDLLGQLAQLALSESLAQRAGGECFLTRVSELLLVEVVRRHLPTLPPQQVGWLAGLRDDTIGRVLRKLHDRPAHGWSLEELAREVGVSRSVLAERFSHFVGLPPMQYLAQWRMQLAAALLASTEQGLSEIAARVGYGSEMALSRAYKRWAGVAPTEWRRAQRGQCFWEASRAREGARATYPRRCGARGVC